MVTLVNRAKVATATTGTGTITLGAAESGYQTFADAGVVDTDVVRYVIEDGTDWEIGTGTYTASGTTLTRTVSESSNADAAIVLTGSATVFIGATAADMYTDADVDTHLNTGTATTGEVLSWTGSDYDWIAAGGGGSALELYAENPSSPTAPSATGTNAVAIGNQSIAAGTNSIALGRSRAGNTDSFAVVIATNSSSYGATGTNAVAIGQFSRATGSDSVAIGPYARASNTKATAIGGESVEATGFGSLAFGDGSRSTGTGATSLGFDAEATANYGLAIGGGTRASAIESVAIGRSANASGRNSFALGYLPLALQDGKYCYASGRFSSASDAQTGTFVLRSDTTAATSEALTTNNAAAGTTNQVILPNNSAYAFSGTIIARQQASAGSEYASWEIKGALLRDGTAATTVLGNGIKNKLFASAGASAWDVTLTADTTNGGLKIEVTGAAATNIRWVATINTSEVTY